MSDPHSNRDAPFFVGYLPMPRHLVVFMLYLVPCLIAGSIGYALAMATAQSDPGNGGIGPYRVMTGTLAMEPYPVVHVPPSDDFPLGRSVILVGIGKFGVDNRAEPHAGALVDAGGLLTSRGEVEMLMITGRVGIRPAEEAVDLPDTDQWLQPESLGRHRLSGEICDGKCGLGAMRPGLGKAHMACANLCLIGGVPAMFLTTGPDGGGNAFLLADADGKRLSDDALLDVVSLKVAVDGAVERRGTMLVFKIDRDTLTVL